MIEIELHIINRQHLFSPKKKEEEEEEEEEANMLTKPLRNLVRWFSKSNLYQNIKSQLNS